MQYLSKFLKPYRLHFIIGPACKLFEAILELLVPIFMADIINHGIIAGNRDKEYIYRTGGWMVLIVTIGLISALVCQYSASLASQGVGTSLRSALFEKVNHLPLHTIEQLGTSTLITRITNDVNQIQLAVAMTIRLVIRAPFVCIGSAVAAAMLNLKLSLVIFLSIPVLGVIVFFVFHSASPLYVKVQLRRAGHPGICQKQGGKRAVLSGKRCSHPCSNTGKPDFRAGKPPDNHADEPGDRRCSVYQRTACTEQFSASRLCAGIYQLYQ